MCKLKFILAPAVGLEPTTQFPEHLFSRQADYHYHKLAIWLKLLDLN